MLPAQMLLWRGVALGKNCLFFLLLTLLQSRLGARNRLKLQNRTCPCREVSYVLTSVSRREKANPTPDQRESHSGNF
jgi:hypothetical protein